MEIFQLILVCSVVQTDPHHTLLYQIAQTSDASVTYIDDLTEKSVYEPNRQKIAHKLARSLVRQNHSIRVGLTQIPAELAVNTYGADFPDLVRGCTSISFGSQHLRKARRKFPNSRSKALAWYFTGSPDSAIGRGWAADVLRQPSINIEQAASNPEAAPPSKSFASPEHQIFSGQTMDLESSNSSKQPNDPVLFESRNSTEHGPSKFPPPEDHKKIKNDTSSHSTNSAFSQPTPSDDSSAATRQQTLRPQSDVTDMSLPTTDDLESAEHPADRGTQKGEDSEVSTDNSPDSVSPSNQ
jgi:hypothetical protein